MDPNSIEAALRTDIAGGVLGPGVPLHQEALAARFGVSRQPIRLVLERLRAAGLVIRRSDRSLVVAGSPPHQNRDLLELRVILEAGALRLALPNLDARALRRTRHAADEIRHAADWREAAELDRMFHATLYAACGNDRMMALIAKLRSEAMRLKAAQLAEPGRLRHVAEEHLRIWQSCADQDVDAALTALIEHLRAS